MNVSVFAQVNYEYVVEVPDNEEDVLGYVDLEDEAFPKLCKILQQVNYSCDGEIISIVNNETGEEIYNNY